jgi:stage II sporulation protein D
MRFGLVTITVLLALVASAAAAPAPVVAKSGPVFVVAGGGWGHGVGMSQWGAYGQARAGRTYDQILGHYFRGTELGDAPAPIAQRVRVLLADGVPKVTIVSSKPFTVADATGARYDLPAGEFAVGPTLELPVGQLGELVALPGPIQFRPGKGGFLGHGALSYRGELRVIVTGKRLQLIDIVPLESYLLGVVPGEMPRDWPLEALKAQAVAARTYAIGNLVKGRSYDLYADWRSQVYYGVGREAPGTTQAVRDTKGKIVTFEGKVAQVFYFSSSGGRTASAVDVYGSDVPYLVSVEDPWDELSPNHRWESRQLTGRELAKAFGLSGAVTDVSITPGSQGAPARVSFSRSVGPGASFRLTEVRARLALKSTTFRLGVLALSAPESPVKAGSTLKLVGVARDVEGAVIERRGSGGTWSPVAKLVPAADGRFTAAVKPSATSTYRLTAVGVGGLAVTVKVSEPSS